MCLLGTVGLFALMDRLVMAGFQRRSGPYSIGWFGLLQPIVDGIKLMKKESIIGSKGSFLYNWRKPSIFILIIASKPEAD